MILAFYMYSFIQVLLTYMFIYVLLMKLLILGAFSGKVSRRFREGFGEVPRRFRGGFGEVSIAPPCPAIENVKKDVSFFRNRIASGYPAYGT